MASFGDGDDRFSTVPEPRGDVDVPIRPPLAEGSRPDDSAIRYGEATDRLAETLDRGAVIGAGNGAVVDDEQDERRRFLRHGPEFDHDDDLEDMPLPSSSARWRWNRRPEPGTLSDPNHAEVPVVRFEQEVPDPHVDEASIPNGDEFHLEPSGSEGNDPRAAVISIWADVPRVCRTCRDFRPAETGERGWCTNKWAFSHRRMVDADECPCETSIGHWWLPVDGAWQGEPDLTVLGEPTPLMDKYFGRPGVVREEELLERRRRRSRA